MSPSSTTKVLSSSYQVPDISALFYPNLDFIGEMFIHKSRISNFTEIRPVAVTLVRTYGRTDMTKVIGAFRDYADLPNFHFVPHRKRSTSLV
jgi:hypothetical protein